MSKQSSNFGPTPDAEDAIGNFLDVAAKICFYAGAIAALVFGGLLIFNYVHFQGAASGTEGLSIIDLFSKVMMVGTIAAAAGSTYLFWGEELLYGFQLIVAGLFFFAPLVIPMIAGASGTNESGASAAALAGIQKSGIVMGVVAILVLVAELILRVRSRAVQGSRTDQLKYGKGIKEEKYQNRLLGKCWQLPYCRKFVREKCPIYHSRRTCWRERVGCMCDEEVIRNAMENKAIPKDAVAAARYIPVNNRLTAAQKAQRCKQCVIYNEHLKHKYKVALPLTIAVFVLLYLAFRSPMLGLAGEAITRINMVLQSATYREAPKIQEAGVPFIQEVILDCFMFVLLAYVLKVLEYVIFKLKV